MLLHLSQDSVFPVAFLPHFARFLFLGGAGWSLRSPTPAKQGGTAPGRENRDCRPAPGLLSSVRKAALTGTLAEGVRNDNPGLLLSLGLFTGISQCKTRLKVVLCFGSGFWKADRTERKNKVFVM